MSYGDAAVSELERSGAICHTYLFDTLGDGAPGGEFTGRLTALIGEQGH